MLVEIWASNLPPASGACPSSADGLSIGLLLVRQDLAGPGRPAHQSPDPALRAGKPRRTLSSGKATTERDRPLLRCCRARRRQLWFEEKRLDRASTLLVGATQECADGPGGETLDSDDELRSDRTLQGVSLDSDELGLPGR